MTQINFTSEHNCLAAGHRFQGTGHHPRRAHSTLYNTFEDVYRFSEIVAGFFSNR